MNDLKENKFIGDNMKKTLNILIVAIIIMSCFCSMAGLLIEGNAENELFVSVFGEEIQLYGSGLYMRDSVSVAAQGRASDLITLILAVPVLIISLILANKGSYKAKLMLTGTLGYFLYTYMSYTFLWMFNSLFLVYTALMSASLYAFVICLLSFDLKKIPSMFNQRIPVKFLGIFQITVASIIALMWLGKIIPAVLAGGAPEGLEHYTTLVIQAMDLGLLVPLAIFAGIMLIKRKPSGYLFSAVVLIKSITMLTAISAMIINMSINGVNVSMAELVVFPLFNLFAVFCFIVLLKNVFAFNNNKEVLI